MQRDSVSQERECKLKDEGGMSSKAKDEERPYRSENQMHGLQKTMSADTKMR